MGGGMMMNLAMSSRCHHDLFLETKTTKQKTIYGKYCSKIKIKKRKK